MSFIDAVGKIYPDYKKPQVFFEAKKNITNSIPGLFKGHFNQI